MKKGDILLEGGLKIVLAAIGIVILIGLIGVVIYRVNANENSEKAKNTLDSIEGKINALNVGENNTFLFQGVEGWYLQSWLKNNVNRPDKCSFDNCLCLCPAEGKESCQEKGVCRFFEKDIVLDGGSLTYTHYSNYNDPGTKTVTVRNYMALPNNLFELYIGVNETEISLVDPNKVDTFDSNAGSLPPVDNKPEQ